MTPEQILHAEGFADGYYKGFWNGRGEGQTEGFNSGFFDGVLTFMTAKFGKLPESVIDFVLTAPIDQVSAVIRHFATVETLDQPFDWRAAYPPDELTVLWQKLERARATRPDGGDAQHRHLDHVGGRALDGGLRVVTGTWSPVWLAGTRTAG